MRSIKSVKLMFLIIGMALNSEAAYSQCNAPVTATTNIYSTQATLTWDPVPSAIQYMLIASLQGIATIDTFYFASTDSFSVFSNLKTAKTYQWAMKSICDSLGTESPLSQVETFTTLPAGSCLPPYEMTTMDITNSSSELHWDAVPDVVGYLVNLGGAVTQISATTTQWTQLQESTMYIWSIASICGVDTMPSSTWDTSSFAIDTFTTKSCPIPNNFIASEVGQDSISLDWSSFEDAVFYNLTGSGLSSVQVFDTVYTINNLSPSTEYYYNIQTVCNTGGSDYSSGISDTLFVTTGNAQSTCDAPTPIFTTNITLETAKLNWTSNPMALSYTVQGKEINSSTYVQLSFNGSISSFEASGLTQGKTYVWKISSNCAADTSMFSDEDTFTTLLCPTPTGLVDTLITANSVWLGWRKVDEAQNYRLYGKKSTNQTVVQYVLPPDTVLFVNSLMSNSTYFWAVQAICDPATNNKSFLSKILSFTTATSAPEKTKLDQNLMVYPNPANDHLYIESPDDDVIMISIVDINGKKMYEDNKMKNIEKIDISQWASGVYFIELVAVSGEVKSEILIVE